MDGKTKRDIFLLILRPVLGILWFVVVVTQFYVNANLIDANEKLNKLNVLLLEKIDRLEAEARGVHPFAKPSVSPKDPI